MAAGLAVDVIFAVDAGTTALKATAISRDGSAPVSAERPIRTYTLPAGGVEQCADEWWGAFRDVMAELCAAAVVRGLRPIALALSGQMQDAIFVDEFARPLRRVILYSDTRARAEAAGVAARAAADGGRPMAERLAGFKGAASLLPKLLWVRAHEPGTLARAACLLLGAHSFLCARLLAADGVAPGENGADARARGRRRRFFTDATTASVCGLVDPATGDWAVAQLEHLCARSGGAAAAPPPIRWADLLPAIVRADRAVGTMSERAAAELGLGCAVLARLPLFHSCGDAGAVTIGVGAGAAGGLYAYLGTSGWVAHTREAAARLEARAAPREGIFTLAHPLPHARPHAPRAPSPDPSAASVEDGGHRAAAAAASGSAAAAAGRSRLELRAASCVSAGGNVEWLRALLAGHAHAAVTDGTVGTCAAPEIVGGKALDRGWEMTSASRPSYAAIDALAARAPPGSGGLLWAPWLAGERSPFTDPTARGCLLGVSHASGAAEMSRAVLEGVAFSTRALLDALLDAGTDEGAAARARARALVLCGGAAKSAIWAQILADVLDLPVTVAAAAESAGARGAAILAAQPDGLGWFSRLDPPGFCPLGETFRPTGDPAVRALLDAHYALHARLHGALRETFAGLAAAGAAHAAARAGAHPLHAAPLAGHDDAE